MPEQPYIFALTICQPYAHLVMQGRKRVENRRWYSGHRGPLLIHAGRSKEFMTITAMHQYNLDYRDLQYGAIVGVADLVHCGPITPNMRWPRGLEWVAKYEHTEGPFCFVLDRIRRFAEPIPWRDEQGMFKVPRAIVEKAEQIEVVIQQEVINP